jgi:crotonobetainyl-CoA:carnitine CoA-transferase CaiB-like acyl-CoA transferase
VPEALQDRQAKSRGDIVEIEHPQLGTVRQIASPLRLSGEPNPLARAPFRGEHTEEVLRELCGYSTDEITALRADGTFGAITGTAGPAEPAV